jgi:gluconolactonase
VFNAACVDSSVRTIGKIDRLDDRLDALIPANAALEVIGEGYEWSEGPLWRQAANCLLFTDIPRNTIYKWQPDFGVSVYMRPSGFSGTDPAGDELGANGLLNAPDGALVVCDHGNRCISRVDEKLFTKTVLVDRYEGRRFNSPNDGIFRSNGDLYFTDPPYGLRGLNDSPDKELEFNGVYRLSAGGELNLLTREMTFPNGIGFSPDEKNLYVANSDPLMPVWKVFPLNEDGFLGAGSVFFDASAILSQVQRGLPDGLAVDVAGNVFATGPGGVLVFKSLGDHLGTIDTGQATSNCAFGGDGTVLFITADMYLCRIALNTRGLGF